MFSILIPTWNNLDYLKLLIQSLREHSRQDYEILIHVNEGTDGTLEWVREQGLRHTHSPNNIGVCLAVNQLAGLATRDWIVFMNDDMVCAPGWDDALLASIAGLADDLVFLSSRLIEPTDTGNPNVLVHDCGRAPEHFDAAALHGFAAAAPGADTRGATSQPTVMSRRVWHMIGGYSLEFSPGMASDMDLLMKLWLIGCRDFRIVDASRIYHFACRSTGRIRKNHGGRMFALKWGISEREFVRRYLGTASGQAPVQGHYPRATLQGRLKRLAYGVGSDIPLAELQAWDAAPAAPDQAP